MIEPFPADPDGDCYVPRPASERAIRELARAVAGKQTRIVLLFGPPGIGKSVVLRQLERSLPPGHACLRMDHAALSSDAICTWLARELEVRGSDSSHVTSWSERLRDMLPMRGSPKTPVDALLQQVAGHQRHGLRVIALIDDADEIDADTIRSLSQVTKQAAGSFRICVASSDERLPAQVTDCAQVVHYLDPMTEDETRAYVSARLARAPGAVALYGPLDAPTLQRLHHFSGGNARRLHAELGLMRIERQLARPSSEPSGGPSDRLDTVGGPEPAHSPAGSSGWSGHAAGHPAPPAPPMRDMRDAPAMPPEGLPAFPGSIAALPEPPARLRAATWVTCGSLALLVAWSVGSLFMDAPSAPLASATVPPSSTQMEQTPPAVASGPRDDLAATDETIAVNINSEPWADIWIDGRAIGETPLADVPLAPGPHVFRAALADGRIVERTIEIDETRRWVHFD